MAKCQTLDIKDATWKKLYKTGVLEFETILTSTEWRKQLASYLFDASMWEGSKLNVQLPEFQKQIDEINSKISEVEAIFKTRKEDVKLSGAVIRNGLIYHLFSPIEENLMEFLEMLSIPEIQYKVMNRALIG